VIDCGSALEPITRRSEPSTRVERPGRRRAAIFRVDVVRVKVPASGRVRDTRTSGALANYPTELETDVETHSGATLFLRPIRSEDERKLLRFHGHLSPESIYTRYFSFHPELSPVEVEHLTHVDYHDRLALVIEDGDELVAVARYERYPGTSEAEVAFVVRDDYQRRGLGGRLFASLAAAARPRGITVFRAETLCRNVDMMSVFHHSGLPMTSSISAGEISVRLSLETPNDETALPTPSPTYLVHPWS
jgi:GNAT superfamily N-acetyltransferase